MDAYLSAAEASGYSGVVLVAVGGRVVLQKGYGFSDRDRGVSFNASTRFPLASIDKTFTAAAILKLEQQGRLKTSDSIAAYFDRVPEDKKRISIHHLLTHTAGLPDYSGPDAEVISRDTLVERMMNVKLQSEPGARFSYSNPSYSLLAVIVEKVSGRPFEAFAQEELFRPAGMTDTSYEVTERDRARLPCSYSFTDTDCKPISSKPELPDGRTWNVRGNSGRWTTAADLYRWHLALRDEAVLSAESKRKAITPYVKTADGGTTGYGYGWFVSTTTRDTRLVAHSGGDQALAANFRRYVDEDVVIVEFTNNAWGPYRRVRDELSKIVFGGEPSPLPSPSLKLPRSSLRRYAGTYQLPSGAKFTVAVKNNQLVVPLDATGVVKLLTRFGAASEHAALPRDTEAKILRLLGGFARDDYEPLRELQWRELKFDEERKFWADTWRQWTKKKGAFTGAETIGTTAGVNAFAPGVRLSDTYVLLHFHRGHEILNFQQNPEGRFFIGYNSTYLLPPYYQLVPLSRTEFAAYNFMLQTSSRVRFQINRADAVTGLALQGDEGEAAAKKID